jgi:SAM-dependent methyltransferase
LFTLPRRTASLTTPYDWSGSADEVEHDVDEVTADDPPGAAREIEPQPGDRIRLVALSFLMLFVELALIRWAGSNVLHLSYFSNFVLLGSFLGIGIGFLRGTSRRDLFPWAPLALAGLVAFVRFFPVDVRVAGSDLIFFTSDSLSSTGPPRWIVLPVIFIVVAAALACLAQGVARVFARFEALEAYRLDILGSLLGIVGFSALSMFRAPPIVWGLVAAVVFVAVRPPRVPRDAVRVVAPLVVLVGILGAESFAADTSWSPYYKVEVEDEGTPIIFVNGVPHQLFLPPEAGTPSSRIYDFLPPGSPGDVLIIGAGGGNDVAVALDRGATRVDAVEIDPRLQELGEERHPSRPYDDPRVVVHIDDGRAYLERTNRTFDLILFALPDSITLVSGQSSLRLESFLFTIEAVEAARDRLAPGGAFAMYNYYREPWLVDRLAGTVADAFGNPPCLGQTEDVGSDLTTIVASRDADGLRCGQPWVASTDPVESPATDDHPFPYLRGRSLPAFYLVTIGLILLASLVAVRATAGRLRRMSPYVDLFCMGVAFLLLETKHVVQFALLFGTTWFVNALVFAGVLTSVLLAIEVARRYTPKRPGLLYVALLAAVVVAWVVPGSALLSLSLVPRFVLAITIAFAPIFLANLIFAERFKGVGSSTAAFGANLLGAMVGGVLEYAALVVGYRSLLWLVAILYGIAFLTGRRYLTPAAATS